MLRTLLWIYLLLKRQLKNIPVLILLVLIPVVAFVVMHVSALNSSDTVRIALYVEDTDQTAVDTVSILVAGDYSYEFYLADSKKQLMSDISRDKAECGYIFTSNLTQQLDSKDYDGCIKCIYDSSSYSAMSGNEIVFSALFKVYAKQVAVNYVSNSDIFEDIRVDAISSIRNQYSDYLESNETFHLEILSLDESDGVGNYQTIEEQTETFPTRKILVILIYIAGMFGSVQYYMDKEKGSFITLPYGYRALGLPLYSCINALVFSVSAEVTLVIIGESDGVRGAAVMLGYVLAVTLFSWALALLLGNARRMITLIPLLVIACLVMCPVFVNVAGVLPIVKYVRYLLLPYYMM